MPWLLQGATQKPKFCAEEAGSTEQSKNKRKQETKQEHSRCESQKEARGPGGDNPPKTQIPAMGPPSSNQPHTLKPPCKLSSPIDPAGTKEYHSPCNPLDPNSAPLIHNIQPSHASEPTYHVNCSSTWNPGEAHKDLPWPAWIVQAIEKKQVKYYPVQGGRPFVRIKACRGDVAEWFKHKEKVKLEEEKEKARVEKEMVEEDRAFLIREMEKEIAKEKRRGNSSLADLREGALTKVRDGKAMTEKEEAATKAWIIREVDKELAREKRQAKREEEKRLAAVLWADLERGTFTNARKFEGNEKQKSSLLGSKADFAVMVAAKLEGSDTMQARNVQGSEKQSPLPLVSKADSTATVAATPENSDTTQARSIEGVEKPKPLVPASKTDTAAAAVANPEKADSADDKAILRTQAEQDRGKNNKSDRADVNEWDVIELAQDDDSDWVDIPDKPKCGGGWFKVPWKKEAHI